MTQNEKKSTNSFNVAFHNESSSSFDAGLHQMKPCKVIQFMFHSGLHHLALGCFAISADCEADWMRPNNQPNFNGRHATFTQCLCSYMPMVLIFIQHISLVGFF